MAEVPISGGRRLPNFTVSFAFAVVTSDEQHANEAARRISPPRERRPVLPPAGSRLEL
jgi:hypothetical protein